jgi:hypothetical protein
MRVQDDVHSQSKNPENLWEGDSIQVSIDPQRKLLNSQSHGQLERNFHEFGFALHENGTVMSWRWIAAKGHNTGTVDNVECAIKRDGSITTYEVAIPWTDIETNNINIQEGGTIGFSLLLNENDGQERRGWMEYMGGIGDDKDPSKFCDLFLLK